MLMRADITKGIISHHAASCSPTCSKQCSCASVTPNPAPSVGCCLLPRHISHGWGMPGSCSQCHGVPQPHQDQNHLPVPAAAQLKDAEQDQTWDRQGSVSTDRKTSSPSSNSPSPRSSSKSLKSTIIILNNVIRVFSGNSSMKSSDGVTYYQCCLY